MGNDRHTDAPSSAANSNSDASHSLFHGGLGGWIKDKAGDVGDVVKHGAQVTGAKVHEVTSSPEFQAGVHKGTAIAGQMGKEVGAGVVHDYASTKHDVQTGNYAGAAVKALPLLAGGPAGLVVKEVAPHVLKAGMNQLPEGTRHSIEGSGLGRITTGAISRGEIPTSPADIARIAMQHAKREAVHEAVDAATHRGTAAHTNQTQEAQVREAPPNSGSPSTQTPNSWFSKIKGMEAKPGSGKH